MDVIDNIISNSTSIRDLSLVPLSTIALVFLWLRTKALEKSAEAASLQADISRSEKYIDQIDKSIDHLNSEKIGVRIHAIQKLKKISEVDSDIHWVCMDILTSFLRERWPSSLSCKDVSDTNNIDSNELLFKQFQEDKKWVLIVLGSRPEKEKDIDGEEFRFLNLRFIDYSFTGITDLDFRFSDFAFSNFEGAYLSGSDFEKSYFNESNLNNAKLVRANLKNACFQKASFLGADFEGANLHKSDFRGADLRGAVNLTSEQLDKSIIDENTRT